MQTLKLKSIFFGFLAIMMASIILTSCEQEELIEDTVIEAVDETALEAEVPTFFFPHGYEDKMSAEELNDYVGTLSGEDFEKLALHRKVVYYFISLNKVELLAGNASYGSVFNENTIAELLSKRETLAFQSFDIEVLVTSRGCTGWSYQGIYRKVTNNGFPLYQPLCYEYHRYTRQCTRWYWPSSTYTDTRLDYIGLC